MGDSFLWDEVEIVFNMSVFSTSTVARLSFSVTRTCIAEKRLIEHLDWGSPCNHHQAIDLVPFICQVCFDQNRCYVTIVLQLQYILLSLFFLKGWTSKGRRWEQLIWDSENTTLPSQSSCVIFRLGHETLKERVLQSKFLQADIVACAINGSENCHIMGALPTGYGKSLPMLVTGLLMPPGKDVNWSTAVSTDPCHSILDNLDIKILIGSTVLVITALTAIAQQLISDCRVGIKIPTIKIPTIIIPTV